MAEPKPMTDLRTSSKTTLPDRSRAIGRPRLIQRVTGASASRVILITGQAAQGKSTLAAQIVRQPGPTAAWMHLDSPDRDPVNFFRLLVHALKSSMPSLDVATFLKNPAIALGPEAGPNRIAELAGTFIDAVIARSPVRIVMDGLEVLAHDAESLALIRRLVQAIAPPSCLVLVAREIPPLKLESLRIRQQLLTFNNVDLAFSTDEIFRFYLDLCGLRLGAPQLTRIRDVTDGWAGGLVLAWEALSHVPEDQRIDFIDKGLPAAMRGERLAYFSEAVFAGLDQKTRDFLVRSAIFDTVDPPMAARCLQKLSQEAVQTVLDRMVRQNLFIQRLFDGNSGWGYRYNQLFRDFLLDKFHTVLDRQEQQALLARAADLAWDAGHFEGAIRFFLQAANFAKAAAGIKKIAMGLSAQGRFADLAGWIDNLPEAMVRDDAWLSFYRAVGRRISGGRRNIQAFSRARDRFAATDDKRGQLLALAYLIEAAVFLGHPTADLIRWLEAAWAMLEKASADRYYPFAKATLWMQVAFGYLSSAGDLQKGLSACQNAMLLAATIRDETLTVNATIIHVFGLTLTGEFAAAEKALGAIGHLVAATYPEYRALGNIVRMDLALAQGDLDRAQELLAANQEDIDRFGLLFLYPIHVDLSGLLQIQRHRFEAVGRTVRHLKDVATLAANPFYSGLALRLKALSAYRQEHFQRARLWAEQAVAVMAGSLKESVHLYRSRLILGMAAYHQGDLTTARQALESASAFFRRVSSHLSLVEAQLALALVAGAMGDAQQADNRLEAGLALAASKGYQALPILSGRDIAAVCRPALQHPRAEIALAARGLMERMHPQTVAAATVGKTDVAAPTRETPAAVESVASRPMLEIRTLGGFAARRSGGDTITDSQWAGLRQKLLLKAIIVNGSREIPKDILMDALWPESSYDAALKRFKVTLHRLRKILEPDLEQGSGASCIFLKDNLVSLDMERCRVDVDEFLACCDKIRQLQRDDDDDRLLPACRQALALYRGDFLPEEPYLSWAETKRAALKGRYLAVRLQMAALFERQGNLEQAALHCGAVIQADPLAEHAYQQYMRLLQRQGRRSAALKVYRDLAQILAAELDTPPDPATTRLYEEIAQS